MTKTLLLTTAIIAVGATSAFAQGFTGAEFGLEYESFSDFDESIISYYGAAEFEVLPQFGASADFSLYTNDAADDNVSNVTFHGFYKLGSGTGVGGFYGRDSLGTGDSIDIYGGEGAYNFGQGTVDGYVGFGDPENSENDVAFSGISIDYDLGNNIGIIAAFNTLLINADSADLETNTTSFEIGGTYTFGPGVTVFGKFGTVDIEVDDAGAVATADDSYIGIGASVGFGPDGGTTFGPRGIFATSPLTF